MSFQTFLNLSEMKQNEIIKIGLSEFATKPYNEANTDAITKACGISKGIIFHYFKSKKNFYLYILENCIKKVDLPIKAIMVTGFYEVIFNSMDEKMEIFWKYPLEVQFINMAAKENNSQIKEEKNKILMCYMAQAQKDTLSTFKQALEFLKLKSHVDKEKILKAISLYVNAIIMRYLEMYKDKPQDFFKNRAVIKIEIKEYIDFMLHGIAEE